MVDVTRPDLNPIEECESTIIDSLSFLRRQESKFTSEARFGGTNPKICPQLKTKH